MQIPVQLIEPSHTLKAINTHALIDSGASTSCLDWGFVRKHSLPTAWLWKPIYTRNADNSINSKGVIRFTSILFLNIEGIARKVTFHVISLGNENVILGLPWLKDVNPTIDWNRRTNPSTNPSISPRTSTFPTPLTPSATTPISRGPPINPLSTPMSM